MLSPYGMFIMKIGYTKIRKNAEKKCEILTFIPKILLMGRGFSE